MTYLLARKETFYLSLQHLTIRHKNKHCTNYLNGGNKNDYFESKFQHTRVRRTN